MQKITTPERQLVLAKPGLPLKERFEVVSEHCAYFVIENQVIPVAADDPTVRTADNMEAWLAVGSVEFLNEPECFRGVLPSHNDQPRCRLVIAPGTGVIGDVQRDRRELTFLQA